MEQSISKNLYGIAKHKAYFDKGYGLLNFVKWGIMFFGFASQKVSLTLWLGIGYAVLCYFLGVVCYKYGYVDAEVKFNNDYNEFIRKMRKKIGIPNK